MLSRQPKRKTLDVSEGLSLWLAYIYMQLLVTHMYVSIIEGVSLNLEITELSSDWCLFFILKHIPYSTL